MWCLRFGSVCLKSRSTHRPFWLRLALVFLSLFRQMPAQYFGYIISVFFQILSNSAFNNHLTFQHCTRIVQLITASSNLREKVYKHRALTSVTRSVAETRFSKAQLRWTVKSSSVPMPSLQKYKTTYCHVSGVLWGIITGSGSDDWTYWSCYYN
jgi:hypothetical protein